MPVNELIGWECECYFVDDDGLNKINGHRVKVIEVDGGLIKMDFICGSVPAWIGINTIRRIYKFRELDIYEKLRYGLDKQPGVEFKWKSSLKATE